MTLGAWHARLAQPANFTIGNDSPPTSHRFDDLTNGNKT
jgi:hypothetical protein